MKTPSRLSTFLLFLIPFWVCACADPPGRALPGLPIQSTTPGTSAVVSSENFKVFTKSSPSSFSGVARGTLYRVSDPMMEAGALTLEVSP